MKTSNGLKVIFAEPIEAGYVKIHSTWDERDVAYSPVDCSETRGTPYDLLEVFIIQKGRRNEWSYDARGNRIDSTVDNNSLVIEYYENSDLLKKYGEWYFNYDANGNMTSRGKNCTETMASNELFEGYVFSSDTGELWTYEYDLSNRLVKVNYSGSGTAELKEKAEYLYDYRGLCIAKTSGNETEYHEYTADGRLIYTERSDYVADYVYSGTSIFAEIRIQDEKKEIFYHHTDHLGTTEAITDESGTIVWKASYEAFGAVLCENGTKVFEASFTGKFFDKDIGLYYFNARWYDAEIGRFVTQDPARDGLNWYAYCLNNPLKYFDPLGLESEEGTTNSNLYGHLTGKFSHSEGFFGDENKTLDRLQTDLDVIGFIPGIGDVADGVNGLISLCRKDYVSAGLDLVSMVPLVGDVIGKGGKTVKQIIKHSDDVIDTGKQIIKHSDEISDVINKSEILIDKSKSYYRSMSNAEAEAVKKTGKLRGGRPGSTFFTDSRFRTAKRAQKRLALPQQPEVQVEFTIKNSPKLERNGTKVKPDFNQIGGGKEFMTNDIVDVEIINVQPY